MFRKSSTKVLEWLTEYRWHLWEVQLGHGNSTVFGPWLGLLKVMVYFPNGEHPPLGLAHGRLFERPSK
jgi:hypothetical protein